MTKKQFVSLKKGNVVRLKKNLVECRYYGHLSFHEQMKFKGVETVVNIEGNGLKVTNNTFWYSYQMLVVVKTRR